MVDVETATFFIGHETLVPAEHPVLGRWRTWLYMLLASNALSPARFYHLPPGRGGRAGDSGDDLNMSEGVQTGWRREAGLTLGALGVVFGDIGTSPLYAMKLSIAAEGSGIPSAAAVFGAMSLIFWTLLIVVTVKYVAFIMRADNNGEGGVMALAALAHRSSGLGRRLKTAIALASIAGPRAVLRRRHADARGLGALRARRRGIRKCGPQGAHPAVRADRPYRALRAATLRHRPHRQAVRPGDGPYGSSSSPGWAPPPSPRTPRILLAADPRYGIALFVTEPWTAFVALGSVVLAVTGCEALYADMGHFGRRPIRFAWVFIALPALLLNYFGQGAVVLGNPHAIDNTFYALAPHWAHYPRRDPRHLRHHHREPGGDLGRLLHHPPGGAARSGAAHGDQAHQRDRDGPRSMCPASTRCSPSAWC
ncbi:MAG: KUP/HAK/KT family potassium transporter [Rhizomicrobium sp.]